ncbi:MAG: DUF4115 domain-containing protein [Thiotrichales bacterium]|jgi:cytoskeletal protein RodZ|nr:DUF4115 domain-containing protein [Thiotrichales bacterium]MBT3612896.1 DUF4115 domain-containing protein [Thiotrichales bacterium]MBT3752333.1 DUF4115 domain-containing protein [Thiotrichales bacterium]MBT3837085.1 DUF4115 domain-containing protein [Thiotrichales bacterium]MBT4152504.1 DUF4115 domain-containing protein [Thiotrichales bacterium]
MDKRDFTGSSSKSIGQILRDKRIELGENLDSPSHRLKINISMLHAIEQDQGPPADFQEVFYQGFVRSYARYLGVDLSNIVADKDKDKDKNKNKDRDRDRGKTGEEGGAGESLDNELNSDSGRDVRIRSWMIILVLALSVSFLIWYLIERDFDDAIEEVPEEIVKEVIDKSIENTIDNPIEKPAEERAESTLTIHYIDSSWTQVQDDDGLVMVKSMLNAGMVKEFKGQEPFDIQLGNAIGVEIKLNGELFDHLNYIEDDNTAHFSIGSVE